MKNKAPGYYQFFKPDQASLVKKHKKPWIAASSDPDRDPQLIDAFNKKMDTLSVTRKATLDDIQDSKSIAEVLDETIAKKASQLPKIESKARMISYKKT